MIQLASFDGFYKLEQITEDRLSLFRTSQDTIDRYIALYAFTRANTPKMYI